MSTASQQIDSKAWNFAHFLRDDGLSYMAYTEQITFLLFLKMADEPASMLLDRRTASQALPEGSEETMTIARSGVRRAKLEFVKGRSDA
ncbi:MAG: type I restriction-modification system subunit M N-terminal domain-containing protein [Pirellulales bacterium]